MTIVSRRWMGLCAGLSLAFHAPLAIAGVIRGVVLGVGSAPAQASASAYPGMAGSMPGMHAAVRGLAQDAVLYVEHVPAEVESTLAQPGPHPLLAQLGQTFRPRVLAIAAGTAVDFPNLDPIYHNVFSLSPVKRFDLGKYPRGHSKTVVFDRVGLVNVYCDIHSDMEAFVMVLPHHAFAQPDSAGRFALPNLPPGHYQLRTWHPDRAETSRAVEVPARGDVVIKVSL